ncbi:MAG: anti-sigma factor [Actinomycetota bacterium]|nr:anti-sigma factor [Actinomycetota bacterium]
MTTRAHEELKELIAPYVLGAVLPEEERELRSHLLSCTECMEESDSYLEVTSSLALSVEPQELPAGFADRVTAAARGVEVGSQPDSVPGRGRSPARRWWQAALVPGMAVLLVATALLAGALLQTRRDLGTMQDVLAALPNADQGFELQGRGQVAGSMVPADDGSVFWVSGLSPAPAGKDYQLWLMEGKCAAGEGGPCDITSVGVFEISDETGVGALTTPAGIAGYDAAAITLEPEGGSDQPTTAPLATSFG